MKIISHGKKPDDAPMRFKCMHCKTIFEADRHERSFIPDWRDGNFWSSKCPVCDRLVTRAAM